MHFIHLNVNNLHIYIKINATVIGLSDTTLKKGFEYEQKIEEFGLVRFDRA